MKEVGRAIDRTFEFEEFRKPDDFEFSWDPVSGSSGSSLSKFESDSEGVKV